MSYQDPNFDKESYWFNRNATDMQGNPKPVRGQDPAVPAPIVLVQGRFRTVDLGVRAMKRQHPSILGGNRYEPNHNPKKRSIRGDVLRHLKAEGWSIWLRKENPSVAKLHEARGE